MKKMKNGEPNPVIGFVEWFKPGDEKRVEEAIRSLKILGITELRTGFSWADWYNKSGEKWYSWLFSRLSKEVNILPCFSYMPPSLGIESKISSPPKNPKDYADFLDIIITKYGKYFEWVELWNEVNDINNWDWRLDPSWEVFSEMIGKAAYWVKQRGKKTVLGGMSRVEPNWIELMCQRNVMNLIDAVGIHGYPGTWENEWKEWRIPIVKVRNVLEKHGLWPEIWITQAGYSTWRHDEYRQLRAFVRFMEAPVERAYWYSLSDINTDVLNDFFAGDERHLYFGIKRNDGSLKLLYRVWENEGIDGVKAMVNFGYSSESGFRSSKNIKLKKNGSYKYKVMKNPDRPVLITGGAGFIGTNLASELLSSGKSVVIFDNLSRPGVEQNLQWLLNTYGDRVQVKIGDIRNYFAVNEAVKDADSIFHFAAQVAVTTSLEKPLNDFEVNVRGTLNLLEAVRALNEPIPLLFTSTNKVYGELDDVQLTKNEKRYKPSDGRIKSNGIDETRNLDFHSPYGCSKGAADQYIKDYARIYGLPTVVFRMSCIYGPHQFGTEDQGWVAHFLIKAIQGETITLYGDGYQVRDILFVKDLIDAMLKAHENIDKISGEIFNIGGGPSNTVSLLELLNYMGELIGDKPEMRFSTWRTGDQKYYVSDIKKFRSLTGWEPKVNVHEGIEKLYKWLLKNRRLNTEVELRVAQ